MDRTAHTKLIDYWNSYFDINSSVSYNETNTEDVLFNRYLLNNIDHDKYEYRVDVCFCQKTNNSFKIWYYDNGIIIKEFGFKAKRKFYEYLDRFKVIISDGIPFDMDNKIILRYELVRNIFTSNHTHFFSKDLPFSIDDYSVFFTKKFIDELKDIKVRYENLIFGSYMLNTFEFGLTIDDIVLKPDITISQYGRWYWSNTTKVQNDIKARNRIWNKFLPYGKIINVDLVSGEPTILSELSNSKLLKKLVKTRMRLKNNGEENLSTILKNVLNIFIHSVDSPKVAYAKFKNNNPNYNDIEKHLGVSVLEILTSLHSEFLLYNKYTINEYHNNLAMIDNYRRIVNPCSILMNDRDLIKNHRIFLQGLVNDKIIEISKNIFKSNGILPIFTIHDSLSYFINRDNEDNIIENLTNISKKLKTPITIEIIEK